MSRLLSKRSGCELALALTTIVASLAVSRQASAEGVTTIVSSASLAPETIAMLSVPTATGVALRRAREGEVVLVRFELAALPGQQLRGLQSYVTSFVPPGMEVVGARLLDEAGKTTLPHAPGLATDGCGRPCGLFEEVACDPAIAACGPDGERDLDDGSIAQVYADVGFFFSGDPRTAATPPNEPLTLDAGVSMSPAPRSVNATAPLIGAASPYYAHVPWDYAQVRAYGVWNSSGNASGNNGLGNAPFGYASPVAGPETFYRFEVTERAGALEFDDVVGPWRRLRSPGATIGTGVAVRGQGPLGRATADASALGVDVRPISPLSATTNAVRVALGEARAGERRTLELALRRLPGPLASAPALFCAEAFGGDTSARSETVRARDNPWPFYLPAALCVSEAPRLTLAPDRAVSGPTDSVRYVVRARNTSSRAEDAVVVRLHFDNSKASFSSASPFPAIELRCEGARGDCIAFSLGRLAPGEERTVEATLTMRNGAHVANVVRASYAHDGTSEPIHAQAVTVVRQMPLLGATARVVEALVPSGGRGTLEGAVRNTGSGDATLDSLTLELPEGFRVTGALTAGTLSRNCARNCDTRMPSFDLGVSLGGGAERPFSVAIRAPAAAAASPADVALVAWATASSYGGAFETRFARVASVPVAARRTAAPVLTCPVVSGAVELGGLVAEADGTVVKLYANLIERASGVRVTGGRFSSSALLTSFGALYPGLELRASARAPGALESELSAPCVVRFVPACSNGVDDDGDGLVDHPSDPGCQSATDSDELERRACSDGVDDDGDGAIDYPEDPGCHAANDDDETDEPVIDDRRPRVLFLLDTSAPMRSDACDSRDASSDDSLECPGRDVPCSRCNVPSCGDGVANDSRLSMVRTALATVVSRTPGVEMGLARFHQRAVSFACSASTGSHGGWAGAEGAACEGQAYADILVGFSDDNASSLAEWLDGRAGDRTDPPVGSDYEVRAAGARPLAGALDSLAAYVARAKTADALSSCRPYSIVLLTSGLDSCGGDAVAAATRLKRAGIATHVLAVGSPASADAGLDAIAAAGNTSRAVAVRSADMLGTALNDLFARLAPAEVCNGEDDDCDGSIDEGTVRYCDRARGVMTPTLCDEPAEASCDRVDDDCDGIVDEGNPGGGEACGTDVGRCTVGTTTCVEGALTCASAVGAAEEACNGDDDDCDGRTDERFVGMGTQCDTGAPGTCARGTQRCEAGAPRCAPLVSAVPETCDALDNDCDGTTDEGDPGGGVACSAGPGICGAGISACVDGAIACLGGEDPALESCNGLDDDCDGRTDERIPEGNVCRGDGRSCGCAAGFVCDAATARCVMGEEPSACPATPCGAGERCESGRCVPTMTADAGAGPIDGGVDDEMDAGADGGADASMTTDGGPRYAPPLPARDDSGLCSAGAVGAERSGAPSTESWPYGWFAVLALVCHRRRRRTRP